MPAGAVHGNCPAQTHDPNRGERIGADDLATLLPLGWEHVNITGDYVWEDQTKLDPDGFRQLVRQA